MPTSPTARLKAKVEHKDTVIRAAREELSELRCYLNLPKFRDCEAPLRGYVNVDDVLSRIREAELLLGAELPDNFSEGD